jgi:arginase family enzyme
MMDRHDRAIPFPVYANQQTFLRCRSGTIADVERDSVVVVGVPQDTTAASRPGARWGPSSIRAATAGLDYFVRSTVNDELVDVSTGRAYRYKQRDVLLDLGDLMTYPLDTSRTVESVSRAVEAIADKGATVVALGGDHFISYPVCRGVVSSLRKRNPSLRMAYIHIDGDLDISDDNRTWGRLFHGTNARRISELPGVDPQRMVMFGISGATRRDQWDFVRDQGITMLTAEDVQTLGPREAMARSIDQVMDGADALYVTCDIDVVNGWEAAGTGAVKLGGLTGADLLEAAAALSSVDGLVGMDVVEVAPEWDTSGRTPVLAASYAIEVLMSRIFDISEAPPRERRLT